MVTLGIDAHKRTHTVVAVDERRPPARREDDDGDDDATDHLELVRWADRFDGERRVGGGGLPAPVAATGGRSAGGRGADRAGATEVDGSGP